MSGVPDYTLESTLDFKFTTRQFSTGTPFAFAAGAVEIYEDNSITQITGAETLTLEFDGVTGLHNLRVAATAANGFENGKSYHCVVSAGTVDSVSVVGEVVQQFSIGRSAAAEDLANGTDGLGAIKAETALIVADTNELQTDWADAGRLDAILDARASQTTADAIETDTQDIQSRLPAALVNSRMDSNVSAIAGVVQSATNLEASTDTIASGTASGTPTTTTMISDIAITDDDQFNGKTIIFASDTTTAGLRKQATDITACTAATNTLTFTALTQAPVSGDTFSIV